MVDTKVGRTTLKERIASHEYELILFVFLLLRFIFKNILAYKEYFTEQIIFGLSDKLNIVVGTVVLGLVCILLASFFGRLIKKVGTEHEKPFLVFVALFFACPATLPFLFDAKSASGTFLLYPFALFAFSIFLVNRPFFKWLVPFVCAFYFIPALYSAEIFFTALQKSAILYVPLILFYLYLDMMQTQLDPNQKQPKRINLKSTSSVLFIVSLLISAGSYILILKKSGSYYSTFFNSEQRLNGYLAVCLLIVSPALVAICAVIYNATKNKFPTHIFSAFLRMSILIFLLFRNNYYGLWIPFLLLSSYSLIFYGLRQRNPAMLFAVQKVGKFCMEKQFLFYIVLIAMASLSNVSSSYLSNIFQKLFDIIPY